ncbi:MULTISPECIES: ABC transporter permease [unclassified Rhizobium]|uniref:ABC transporter permease n=1 Tax=unclassified Rhizobium TaxID=2613769 RepID=UPI0006F4ECBA|nr:MULTISPECIES: ABC transporter permease [unclassified Rhizobium]KQV40784.1 peptide ABC transporter permease [Rhizobium sp. Root1212]KRD36072.1 peptide ABC transporter permease [Rhizobium sp. Root268]
MRSASLQIHLAFKLTTALLAVAGSVVLLLTLTRLIPGDPATVILGSRATPEAVAALNARIGLDKPLIEQVFAFFRRLFSGDLGQDVFNGRPVLGLVLGALPNTAALAISAMLCAIAFGVPLALLSARRPGGRVDRLVAFLSVGFISTPSFVVSVFLLMVFSVTLRWFPVLGAGESGDLGDQLWHLVLPTAALAAGWIGYIARLLRSSLLEMLGENHIRTLRAYGVSEAKILMKYALKPAVLPTVAVVGMGFGELLGGAVFAEVIFNRPGLGSLIYDAIRTRNYPVVQGGVFVIVLLYVLTNLIADLSQSLIDPRERARLASGRGQ